MDDCGVLLVRLLRHLVRLPRPVPQTPTAAAVIPGKDATRMAVVGRPWRPAVAAVPARPASLRPVLRTPTDAVVIPGRDAIRTAVDGRLWSPARAAAPAPRASPRPVPQTPTAAAVIPGKDATRMAVVGQPCRPAAAAARVPPAFLRPAPRIPSHAAATPRRVCASDGCSQTTETCACGCDGTICRLTYGGGSLGYTDCESGLVRVRYGSHRARGDAPVLLENHRGNVVFRQPPGHC